MIDGLMYAQKRIDKKQNRFHADLPSATHLLYHMEANDSRNNLFLRRKIMEKQLKMEGVIHKIWKRREMFIYVHGL